MFVLNLHSMECLRANKMFPSCPLSPVSTAFVNADSNQLLLAQTCFEITLMK